MKVVREEERRRGFEETRNPKRHDQAQQVSFCGPWRGNAYHRLRLPLRLVEFRSGRRPGKCGAYLCLLQTRKEDTSKLCERPFRLVPA